MSPRQSPTFPAVLTRLGWMLFGPILLVVFGVLIIKTGEGWLTPWDFAFLAALGGVILFRWLDFRSGFAQTAEGAPLTTAQLRNYTIGVLVVGLLAWVGANAIGNGYFGP